MSDPSEGPSPSHPTPAGDPGSLPADALADGTSPSAAVLAARRARHAEAAEANKAYLDSIADNPPPYIASRGGFSGVPPGVEGHAESVARLAALDFEPEVYLGAVAADGSLIKTFKKLKPCPPHPVTLIRGGRYAGVTDLPRTTLGIVSGSGDVKSRGLYELGSGRYADMDLGAESAEVLDAAGAADWFVVRGRRVPESVQEAWDQLHRAGLLTVAVPLPTQRHLPVRNADTPDVSVTPATAVSASAAAAGGVNRPPPPGVTPDIPAGSVSLGFPLGEANVLVRDWLNANSKSNPAAVTRAAVAKATRVSTGQVSKTAAWKAFVEERDANNKPGPREVPLTDDILAVFPGDCKTSEEIAALVEEGREEEAEQDRRHERRHRPS